MVVVIVVVVLVLVVLLEVVLLSLSFRKWNIGKIVYFVYRVSLSFPCMNYLCIVKI